MKTLRKIAITMLPIMVVSLFVVPLLVGAVDITTKPTNPYGGKVWTLADVENLIKNIANFIIGVGIFAAIASIVWGAILFATAAGSDEKAGKGKKWMINGIIAGVVIVSIGVILSTLSGVIAGSFV